MSINKRVLNVYNELVKLGRINNQNVFAEQIGYSQPAINYVFNGKRNVSPNLVSSLVDKFGVSRSYLFDGKEPMFNEQNKLNNNIVEETQNKERQLLGRIDDLENDVRLLKSMVNSLISSTQNRDPQFRGMTVKETGKVHLKK